MTTDVPLSTPNTALFAKAVADYWNRSGHTFLNTAFPLFNLLSSSMIAQRSSPHPASQGSDFSSLEQFRETLDRLIHASIGRTTRSISPTALALAYLNWAAHLAWSPGKQLTLVENGLKNILRFYYYAFQSASDPSTPECITPLPQDHRFSDPAWRIQPFNLFYQMHLLMQAWMHRAASGIHGVSHHHEQLLTFLARQILDLASPSNFIITNPVVLKRSMEEGGANFVRGFNNLIEDQVRIINKQPPAEVEMFRPGDTVAITPGHVVMRNRLVELIQYAPTTPKVHADPILIVPAWIMKYYILDLSPQNSLIKFLVDRGHTVFCLSWRNPDAEDSEMGMDDYLHMGVLDALKAVQTIVPGGRVHAAGYCLGGTLLAIAAAYLAREHDESLKSMTLFAAQTDFTDAGELSLFIDEAQISLLEDVMWSQGYLDTKQMAGAFQLLRSNDLVWSHMVQDYLLGQRQDMTDLMAWNADSTRMPYRMHSEYLRSLFLNNDLFEGRYVVRDHNVALSDIKIPIFAVATESDHVAPWKSVYKIHLLADMDITFVLTNGGHNAGIVSEPGHSRRRFLLSRKTAGAPYEDADTWRATHSATQGSWWPAWDQWLAEGKAPDAPPPAMGAGDRGYPPQGAAPGTYVMQE